MPRISFFYGIAIHMYYKDHSPPHIHAIYGEHEAVVDIRTAATIDGSLPRRAEALVLEWVRARHDELLHAWANAIAGCAIAMIEPLD